MSGTMSRENRWLRLWPASRWSTATARATKVPTQANSVSEPDLVRADTLAEAAAALKLDADVLQKTIDDDNAACAASVDTEFAKPAASLVVVGTTPFYIAKLNQYYLMSVGGIECDINARVVDSAKTPIEGLYAVGTDGCMLHRNIYTINVGGSTCNCNNINSGRTAANHAHSLIGA